MGINQAIYTSSARGIDKGGGMGIHTYNRNCSAEELKEFELSYCQYIYSGDDKMIPQLPVKLLYGKTESGRYIQACITYIGKDYDKVKGRMGNFISHMYSFTKDSMSGYPIELYGGPAYRTSMKQEEIDGSMPVDYLQEVRMLPKGHVITVESVQDFLNDGRMEMFCHLMAAVLHRDQVHKVIIYDTHENILLWLGAVQFALPLQCAKEVSFSSCERDPMMSEFDLRGAVVGMSRGRCEDYAVGGQFYVFDGIQREYPKFDISEDYFQYGIEMGLAFSYDSLLAFFAFMKRYVYEKADQDLLRGFKLYQMTQGGMGQLTAKEFNDAVAFEAGYGSLTSYSKMLADLFERLESNTNPDKNLTDNICSLLTGYLKKNLTTDELKFVLGLILQLDHYMSAYRYDSTDVNKMWLSFYGIMAQYQEKNIELICRILGGQEVYRRLGEFESYICQIQQSVSKDEVEEIFIREWKYAPLEAYRYFDQVIAVAATKLKDQEDGPQKYETAIELFLWLQEVGKGHIIGRGCEQLISIIEQLTQITNKKQFSKKRKSSEKLDKKCAKCAVEVQNYCNMNHMQIPATKIRLLHFGNIIVRAIEHSKALTRVREMSIYEMFPVIMDDIGSDDFKNYIGQLAEIMDEYQTTKDEYALLFKCLKLNDRLKEIMIETFMDHETAFYKKEKEIKGLSFLLSAVREYGDEEYEKAMEKYVASMRTSRREKITDSIREECDRELYMFWKKMKDAKGEKETKKGHFIFGRR